MNNEKRNVDIICDSLLPLSWFIIVIICLFLSFSSTVHAEDTITPLPYYVNYHYSDYFHLSQEQLDVISPFISNTDYTFYWLGEPYNYNSSYYGFYIYGCDVSQTGLNVQLLSSDLNYDVDYNMFDIMNDYVVLSKGSGTFVRAIIRINKNTGEFSVGNVTIPTVRSSSLLGLGNKTINNYGFTPNVPITFTSNDPFLWQGNSEQIIFVNGSPVPPTPEDDNITDDTNKPNWSDYSVDWSTGKPTFDTDHPFDSLFSIMSWSFEKLADSFTGGFNFLVDSLNWSLQTFLNNVRAKFQLVIDKVNDFKDLVDDSIQSVNGFLSDIKDSFDYLIEPIDITEIDAAFQGSIMYNLFSIGGTLKSTFSNFFDSIPQPDSLSFTIPYTILTKTGNITIDFSWYSSIRSSVLPWIVGFLYAGFGLAVFRSIPSIIHGVSGVLQKGG